MAAPARCSGCKTASSRCALSNADPARAALDQTFRRDYGRLVAALTRRLGAPYLELAEDAVQSAIVRALERWPAGDVPERVDGWLLRVAFNVGLDVLRREQRLTPLLSPEDVEPEFGQPVPAVDDELRLIFLCCHPDQPRAAQLALTLKIAGGFTVPQIARAFLTNEATVAQRIVRAKQRLRQVGARFELPGSQELGARLGPILDVIYLGFSEGYSPTDGDDAIKDALCGEMLRLIRLLVAQPATATPAAEALHALMCFQAARAAARRADDGSLLLLAEQDRTRWDTHLIGEAFAALARAGTGYDLSRFHLEAGIAACHTAAPSYQATDWPQIRYLYDELRRIVPSPVVEVNRAIAVAMVAGAVAGLEELDSIPEREVIESYPYALAAYAELHASLGHVAAARSYLTRALEKQPARAQRLLLQRKLAGLAGREF